MANSLGRGPYVFGLLFLVHAISAFHSGAPCSTQYAMVPSTIFHGEAQNLHLRPPPYEFQVLDLSGRPVTAYKNETYKSKVAILKIFGSFQVRYLHAG